MKKIILYILPLLLLVSCYKKEDALQPSEGKDGYVVPQGNNDYDQTIVNFYEKYGKYLLYEFTDKDTYWTPGGWKNSTQNASGAWSNGYEAAKADPAYVASQLKLLDTIWFKYYSDAFLKEFLPVKIMLCRSVDSVFTRYVSFNPLTIEKGAKPVAAWFNYDNICVNHGNQAGTSLTPAEVKAAGAKLNLIFGQSIGLRRMASATTRFAAVANYNATISTQAAAYGQGIIYTYYNSPNADLDWGFYMLAMMTTSEQTLNTSTPNTDASFKGILNTTKDSNGRIRQRYNIVREYYKENYNVDLQAVGNAFN